ncbi:glycosyltransferase family 2 protein [Chlamydiota bacterium]
MNEYKVSVIIPTYNRKDFVCEAIASVIDQTYRNTEIIVIDDGSTDNTKEAVQSQFPQVIYHYQDNKGISRARNAGIGLALGEFISFLDSDDLWKKNKLLMQMEAISSDPGIKICYTNEIWLKEGQHLNQKLKHKKYGGYIFEKCLPLCIISASSIIIHKSIFTKIGLFDETYPVCEDYDYWLRLSSHYPIHFIDNKLIIKRGGHTDQLSKKYWGMDRFRVKSLETILQYPSLSSDKKLEVYKELEKKCSILAKGYKNRQKAKKSSCYSKQAEKWKYLSKKHIV